MLPTISISQEELMGVLTAGYFLVLLGVAVVLVPASFIWGWISNQPDIYRGIVSPKGKKREEASAWRKIKISLEGPGALEKRTSQPGGHGYEINLAGMDAPQGPSLYGYDAPGEERSDIGHSAGGSAKSGKKAGKKLRKPKTVKLKVGAKLREDLANEARDLPADFVSLGGRLCGFSNKRQVFYRHSDMIKNAKTANIGNSHWLFIFAASMLLCVPIVSDGRLAVIGPELNSLLSTYGFIPPIPEQFMPMIFFVGALILFSFLWSCLAWLRANTLTRRVENALNWLDDLHHRQAPPQEKNPLPRVPLAALGFLFFGLLTAMSIIWALDPGLLKDLLSMFL